MSGPLPWWGHAILTLTVASTLAGMTWTTRRHTRKQQTNHLHRQAEQIIYDAEFDAITRPYKDQP